jgi:hypothetical protein
MLFEVPSTGRSFEIPDEWWDFCDMRLFKPQSDYFPYDRNAEPVEVLDLRKVEPPRRDAGMTPFKKYKLVPVLLAFTSPECALPPIHAVKTGVGYAVRNGFHRFYASVAVGYQSIPAVVLSNDIASA